MNDVTLLGNLGSDPISLGTPEHRTVQLNLATVSSYTDKVSGEPKKETTWHTVFFYGKRAEALLRFFKKGQEILLKGSIRTNKYKDKDGVERTGYFIKGDEWFFTRGNGNGASKDEAESNVQEDTASVPQKPATVAATKTATPAAKKPLVATVTTAKVSHTEQDLSFGESDPTEDDLPF